MTAIKHIFALILILLWINQPPPERTPRKSLPNEYAAAFTPCRESVLELIGFMQIENPSLALSITINETGNYTSELCLKYHNLFGMRPSKNRTSTATGHVHTGNGTFATYDNYLQSVLDYRLRQIYFGSGIGKYCNKGYERKINLIEKVL